MSTEYYRSDEEHRVYGMSATPRGWRLKDGTAYFWNYDTKEWRKSICTAAELRKYCLRVDTEYEAIHGVPEPEWEYYRACTDAPAYEAYRICGDRAEYLYAGEWARAPLSIKRIHEYCRRVPSEHEALTGEPEPEWEYYRTCTFGPTYKEYRICGDRAEHFYAGEWARADLSIECIHKYCRRVPSEHEALAGEPEPEWEYYRPPTVMPGAEGYRTCGDRAERYYRGEWVCAVMSKEWIHDRCRRVPSEHEALTGEPEPEPTPEPEGPRFYAAWKEGEYQSSSDGKLPGFAYRDDGEFMWAYSLRQQEWFKQQAWFQSFDGFDEKARESFREHYTPCTEAEALASIGIEPVEAAKPARRWFLWDGVLRVYCGGNQDGYDFVIPGGTRRVTLDYAEGQPGCKEITEAEALSHVRQLGYALPPGLEHLAEPVEETPATTGDATFDDDIKAACNIGLASSYIPAGSAVYWQGSAAFAVGDKIVFADSPAKIQTMGDTPTTERTTTMTSADATQSCQKNPTAQKERTTTMKTIKYDPYNTCPHCGRTQSDHGYEPTDIGPVITCGRCHSKFLMLAKGERVPRPPKVHKGARGPSGEHGIPYRLALGTGKYLIWKPFKYVVVDTLHEAKQGASRTVGNVAGIAGLFALVCWLVPYAWTWFLSVLPW